MSGQSTQQSQLPVVLSFFSLLYFRSLPWHVCLKVLIANNLKSKIPVPLRYYMLNAHSTELPHPPIPIHIPKAARCVYSCAPIRSCALRQVKVMFSSGQVRSGQVSHFSMPLPAPAYRDNLAKNPKKAPPNNSLGRAFLYKTSRTMFCSVRLKKIIRPWIVPGADHQC